jgi:hypothetical protein
MADDAYQQWVEQEGGRRVKLSEDQVQQLLNLDDPASIREALRQMADEDAANLDVPGIDDDDAA